jgi:hypothetical protein
MELNNLHSQLDSHHSGWPLSSGSRELEGLSTGKLELFSWSQQSSNHNSDPHITTCNLKADTMIRVDGSLRRADSIDELTATFSLRSCGCVGSSSRVLAAAPHLPHHDTMSPERPPRSPAAPPPPCAQTKDTKPSIVQKRHPDYGPMSKIITSGAPYIHTSLFATVLVGVYELEHTIQSHLRISRLTPNKAIFNIEGKVIKCRLLTDEYGLSVCVRASLRTSINAKPSRPFASWTAAKPLANLSPWSTWNPVPARLRSCTTTLSLLAKLPNSSITLFLPRGRSALMLGPLYPTCLVEKKRSGMLRRRPSG